MFNGFSRHAQFQSSDNRLSSARNIGILSGQKRVKDFVGLKDRIDFYSFRITGRSSFNLSLSQLQNNVDVTLLKGQKIISRSAKAGKKPEAIKATLEPGTYAVRVNQKQGNSKYTLTLKAALSSAPNPNPTPNPSPNPTPNPSPSPASRRLVSLLTSGGATTPRLGFIDLNTGNLSQLPLGNMEGTVLQDIATFGNDTFAVANPNNLYRIDPNTSTYTLISNLVSIANTTITSLGFTSSGSLYAAGSEGDFYTINTTTGKATLVATIPGFSASGDLAYDATSNRFFATSRNSNTTDSLYSIGLAGDARLIGNTGFTNVWGLLFENGTLYGFTPQQQLKINLTTGTGTLDQEVKTDGPVSFISGTA